MEPPLDGLELKSESSQDTVCKLNKGIYGLRQSGRIWTNTINEILVRN